MIIKLVCSGVVSGFRRTVGVVEINMNPELITFTYNNIVKSTLGNIFQTIESAQNNTLYHLIKSVLKNSKYI